MWHTSPVTLNWLIDTSILSLAGGDCGPHVISSDTKGTSFTCSVTSLLTGTLTKTATVKLDQTPPTVTGAAPARPPDHNGWYNHPVAFTFSGTDVTSGIAGCDNVLYSGPDNASGLVRGSCHDVAGNTGNGSTPIKYDATPPTLTLIPSTSPPGEISLTWTSSPDTDHYTVTRSPGKNGAKSSTVYTGTQPSYTDSEVANSTTYNYTIVATDAAANATAIVISAITGGSQTILGPPTSSTGSGPDPSTGTRTDPKQVIFAPPRLQWRRMRRASYYNVQVYRRGHKILSAWPRGSHIQLTLTWRFRGRLYSLTAGRYAWYVWPGYGNRRAHRYGRLITHRTFRVPKFR